MRLDDVADTGVSISGDVSGGCTSKKKIEYFWCFVYVQIVIIICEMRIVTY